MYSNVCNGISQCRRDSLSNFKPWVDVPTALMDSCFIHIYIERDREQGGDTHSRKPSVIARHAIW